MIRKLYDKFIGHLQTEKPNLNNNEATAQPTKKELLVKLSDAMFKVFDRRFNFGKLNKAALNKKVNQSQSNANSNNLHTLTCDSNRELNREHMATEQRQPNPEKKEASTDQKELCCICLDKKANAVLFPCCHGKICFECGKVMLESGVCHLCRNVFA